MVKGRSKQAVKQSLADRPEPWREGVEMVAMNGFKGFGSAAREEFTHTIAVMAHST
jgi:hypothetical protein